MKKYEIGFVFFIESENTEEKNKLVSDLNRMNQITVTDIYNDGEDWNVECTATIECNATKKIDDAIHNILIDLLPNVCWDYHYIKGIDNDFYWQP